MKLAIISDIHGNLEAFKEVLTDIDQSRIDGVVCLGDNIGYGPEPENVVELIRRSGIPCVMGNHELAVLDSRYLNLMNPSARESLLLTQQLISAKTVEYVHSLPSSAVFHGALCVHGCPPNSPTTYLFQLSEEELVALFGQITSRMVFVGHTHSLEIVSYDGHTLSQEGLNQGITKLARDQQYIVNVGSVGQPRDEGNEAKYVIWDRAAHYIEVRYIPYDISATADKILELGFPEFNANRLW